MKQRYTVLLPVSLTPWFVKLHNRFNMTLGYDYTDYFNKSCALTNPLPSPEELS